MKNEDIDFVKSIMSALTNATKTIESLMDENENLRAEQKVLLKENKRLFSLAYKKPAPVEGRWESAYLTSVKLADKANEN